MHVREGAQDSDGQRLRPPVPVAPRRGSAATPARAAPLTASETYGQFPLHSEANRGQTHEDVRFLARGPGYSLYLTAGEAVLVLARPNADGKRDSRSALKQPDAQTHAMPVVVHMGFVGAAAHPRMSPLEELPRTANYFIGNHPAQWQTNVPNYANA